MTWKEFKEAVEAQGVKDDDEIWYIDVVILAPEPFASSDIRVGRDAENGIVIE